MRLEKREAYNARRDHMSYPPIPDATEFQNQRPPYDREPVTVHGWQWSTTFGKWSALVTFKNGWRGFTYPDHAEKHDGARYIVGVTIGRKDRDSGQYQVQAWDQHGKRWPDADYFTDDREDAHATADAMIMDSLAQQQGA